ncbi:hypothetical protein EG68_06308 [Paragonimus skrjabini miyazakii]|uniref:Tetraspanin n=1 Tax=Paragonimus skrjabini miyazakii TaxID=59628 RepID=A0A8S9Z2N9_9TREM|nr:hypothetical protein EG68_06308 [Paragonimus skrjabini miyazakii]
MCKVVSGTFVVLVNLLFIPISLALIIIGALVRWNRQMLIDRIVPALVEDVKDENLREAAAGIAEEIFSFLASYGLVVFIFGIFLFVLTFCGIFGVCCRSKILLGTYTALLLVIFLALLIFTIVFGTRSSWFRTQVQDAFKKIIVDNFITDNERPPNTALTRLISMLQQNKKCCGSYDYRDYYENESFRNQPYRIPASCCKVIDDRNCWEQPTSQNSYMNQGCFDFLWGLADTWYKYVLYALVGLLLFTFIFAVISIYLLSRYSREELKLV